jgi:hypothetical protein
LNVSNHHRPTLLIKWNILAPNLNHFMVWIETTNHFFSL